MKPSHIFLGIFSFLLLLSPHYVAGATEVEGSDPLSFYAELFVFIILTIATVFIFRIGRRVGILFKDGLLKISLASLFFTIAMATIAVGEFVEMDDSLIIELTFEFAMVVGGVLLFLGARSIGKKIENLSVE